MSAPLSEADHDAYWRPLGQLLVQRGLLTQDELEAALDEQERTGGLLGEILMRNGLLSKLALASSLHEQSLAPDPESGFGSGLRSALGGADPNGQRDIARGDERHSRLNWGTSTSAPARKVSTMPANVPTKASQSGTLRSNTFPTTTPAASSIRATDSPTSTEIIAAARTVAARIAAIASSLNRYLLAGVDSLVEPISPKAVERETHPATSVLTIASVAGLHLLSAPAGEALRLATRR